ncbi:MAG: Asp/Glu racemase [Acetobacter sp.]
MNAFSPPLDLGVLPSVLDGGVAQRAALGMVVLATDQTLEPETAQLVRMPGVVPYVARLWNDADITPETLRAIQPRIAPATELILPGCRLDVVGFGCTSATMVLGEETVFAEIRKARPGIACSTPITGALAAISAFGARRVGLLTPYVPEINLRIAAYFAGRGVHVSAMATFDRRDDLEVARIRVADIVDAARRMTAQGGFDMLFVSCTSLRVVEAVAEIEAATGIPVTSSNHAMIWHMLRTAGVDDTIADAGRLFTMGLAG